MVGGRGALTRPDGFVQLAAGTSIGPYVVAEPLGAGGMGVVYRARDPRLGRDVAIKVLTGASADAVSRFEREARALAALSHPNILAIFDVGTHDGVPFLVSELLRGLTLRRRLADGALPVTEALTLGVQLARGLAAAHGLRILHRDLKPENLFVLRDRTLKILDFGLAKLRPDVALETEAITRTLAPSDQDLLGTPGYMAPEQLRGEPVDERADLFAVGTVLHEMVTGSHPFRRASLVETLSAVLHDTPAQVPAPDAGFAALWRIIRRCLEKDPTGRFQSAADLAFALESLSDSPAPSFSTSSTGEDEASIAVLPFADMSPARDHDWLCEGVADELINVLTHIDGLRVASRSSSFQFRTSGVDVRAVGARLGVATVLEGGVQRLGDRLRITVRLVNVADGYQRWSARFDGTVETIFAVQDQIAENVATALRGMLTAREKQALHRPETAVECYEHYLRAQQFVHRFDRPSLESARHLLERAIAIDPAYAPAYAGLATVHCWFYEWWGGGADDFAAADRASQSALRLAPELAEAHAARGFVLSTLRRYEEAAGEFEQAIRFNPNSFDAYYLYARMSFASGQMERAAHLFRRAGEVRLEDFQSMILLYLPLRKLGRADEAREANREGIRRAERQLELDPANPRALSLGANALLEDGQRERAIRWSEKAMTLHPDDQGVLINGACLRARAGLKEEALAVLERTFARGWGKRDWIEHDPDYDSLRDDPRFQALLARLR